MERTELLIYLLMMERTEILIYLLIILAVIFLVVRYWKTGRQDEDN